MVLVCVAVAALLLAGSQHLLLRPDADGRMAVGVRTDAPSDVITPAQGGGDDPTSETSVATSALTESAASVAPSHGGAKLPVRDPRVLEVPAEDPEVDGAVYNASGVGFTSSVAWQGKCWYRVTNFCVVNGVLTLFHPRDQGEARGGSLRMCNEFSTRSQLIRLKYRSEPEPDVLPGPLLTKTQGWVLQFWCQDLFHMTLSLLPAFNTKQFLGDHPDIYVRIAKGKRKKSAFCRIKFGDPESYEHVRNPKWGGDNQFPFPGNPYWPFYEAISRDPWRIHPLYEKATAKRACYRTGAIDKLYIKDMTGAHAANYTEALKDIMRVPAATPRRCGKYRVTVIDRRGRTRRLTNIPEIVATINSDPEFHATPVALETLPIRDQLALMTNTDVLMGMHGNGITWLQFLAPGSVVIELIGVWYQPYAKLWGLKHLHSSMKNNMIFKQQGEYEAFPHNITEIRELLSAAKQHLRGTSCNVSAANAIGPSKLALDYLYSECTPHC